MIVLGSTVPRQTLADSTFCAAIERTNDGYVNLRKGPGTVFDVFGTVIQSHILRLAFPVWGARIGSGL